tara:strand:+ start:555 stop:1061 length:507 start_codon:yes stop_codon:yes gene_type:complete
MGVIAACWGFLGIFTLFSFAIVRLSRIGIDSWSVPFGWHHWLALTIWILFMAYNEGYKGFQRGFSPRVAARTAYLYRNPSLLRLLFAPLFCMGYFDITRKRQILTFALTLMIIVLVQAVSLLEQPWRGIVDLGVVIGLAWGLITLSLFTFQALTQDNYPHSHDVPAQT